MYSEKSKIIIRLDSLSKQIYNIWAIFRLYQSFRRLPCEICQITVFFSGFFARSYRVTDEAFIAET